jgi:hypothetical protein
VFLAVRPLHRHRAGDYVAQAPAVEAVFVLAGRDRLRGSDVFYALNGFLGDRMEVRDGIRIEAAVLINVARVVMRQGFGPAAGETVP